ncbi:MAG: mitochondrial fission ELM1 family protein [Rhodanobacteraceae bacterium]
MNDPQDCWAISDGSAGNARQVRALARAMKIEPRLLDIRIRAPWRWLAPRFVAGARNVMRTTQGNRLPASVPALAIGCGRQAALLTRVLREESQARCFTVQILDPRIDPAHFDIVIAPRHDALRAANVITTIGALNPIDPDWLVAGRTRFANLAALPAPRRAVLIGASNRAQRLDDAYFDALLARMAAWHGTDGGSFLVTTSRRTPQRMSDRLRTAFAAFPGAFWAGSANGENPYAGFIAWADRIIVTPDSVNLISEACATGKPVYTFAPRPVRGKLAAFHAELAASGHLRRIDDASPSALPLPLAETAAVAELVRERWRAFVDAQASRAH